jgi:uncharacterized membrane protein YdjX (TVP38/TMEM64 family)
MGTMHQWQNVGIVAGFLVGVGVVVYFIRENGLLDPTALRSLVATYSVYAPLVYVVLYAAATMLAIPGAALTLTGGVLFGPLIGTVATVAGASLGATGSFLLVRFFRRSISMSVGGRDGRWQQVVAKYDARIAASGFLTVFILRLMPIVPFSALNYALGFTSVRTRDYVLATILGIIPGTFAYVYFGDALAMLMPSHIVAALALIGGVVLLGKYLQRRYG